MTYKRLCLPAPNDYNSGLCDYYGYGYGETETVEECCDVRLEKLHYRIVDM